MQFLGKWQQQMDRQDKAKEDFIKRKMVQYRVPREIIESAILFGFKGCNTSKQQQIIDQCKLAHEMRHGERL